MPQPRKPTYGFQMVPIPYGVPHMITRRHIYCNNLHIHCSLLSTRFHSHLSAHTTFQNPAITPAQVLFRAMLFPESLFQGPFISSTEAWSSWEAGDEEGMEERQPAPSGVGRGTGRHGNKVIDKSHQVTPKLQGEMSGPFNSPP
jgi:hypothetical protein